MPDFLADLITAVRAHDAERPRSQQAAVGWSEVGGCRSYLAYRLKGEWPSDTTDTWGASRGTAIHEMLAEALAGRPGLYTELSTQYRGIPGHADLCIIHDNSIGDFKSTSLKNSRHWRRNQDVLWEKRVQVMGYAAGLIEDCMLDSSRPVTVRLIVIPVDGTFADWWVHEELFDRSIADWGADRLEEVKRRMQGTRLMPRDRPPSFCRAWCPFVSMCRPEVKNGKRI
jgi:hypothetical protein